MRKWVAFFGAVACLGLGACISVAPFGFGNNRGPVALEVIQPADHWYSFDQVLMIPLSGLVTEGSKSSLTGEPGMLVALKDRLKAAEENPRIKAVVLRIDSPGGTITAADLIFHEIMEFKERTGLPVIALMTDTAASGGLYISMAADEIYALPTTLTGSIGVIVTLPGLKGLSDKLGFEMRVIKSGAMKDAGSPWRTLSDDERKLYQDLIDRYFQQFREIILAMRKDKGLTEEKLDAIADGRVLDADTALKAGLIDGILYPREVYKVAMDAAGLSDAKVVSYEYPGVYRGHIYAQGQAAQPLMGNALRRGRRESVQARPGATSPCTGRAQNFFTSGCPEHDSTARDRKKGPHPRPKRLFKAGGLVAGIKASGAPDLGAILCDRPATTAAVMTTNLFCGAPVTLARERLEASPRMRGVMVNAGIANACTGRAGPGRCPRHGCRRRGRLRRRRGESFWLPRPESLATGCRWIRSRRPRPSSSSLARRWMGRFRSRHHDDRPSPEDQPPHVPRRPRLAPGA